MEDGSKSASKPKKGKKRKCTILWENGLGNYAGIICSLSIEHLPILTA
jgi:hypothetical protein